MKNNIFNSFSTAIVCPANSTLMGGNGLDGAIRNKLSKPINLPRQLATGSSFISDAPGLMFNNIIHTASPIWKGGLHNEIDLLSSCYKSIIQTCISHSINSVAIPAIGTGCYGFPVDLANNIAQQEIIDSPIDITLYPGLSSPAVPDDFVVYNCCGNQWELALHPMFPERLDWFPICECGRHHKPAYQMKSWK